MYLDTKELTVTQPKESRRWQALADAIRLGCLVYPYQAFNVQIHWQRKAACVKGAALAGGFPEKELWRDVRLYCPQRESCYRRRHFGGDIEMLLFHLNDDHRWRREDIADYLETL